MPRKSRIMTLAEQAVLIALLDVGVTVREATDSLVKRGCPRSSVRRMVETLTMLGRERAKPGPKTVRFDEVATEGEAPTVETRLCKECGEVWPVMDFVRAPNKPGGYGYRCKMCERRRLRESRLNAKTKKNTN